MQFYARAAKLPEPSRHLTIDGYPGLRLEVSAITRTWIYRYKSPVNGKVRQKKLGQYSRSSSNSPASRCIAIGRVPGGML